MIKCVKRLGICAAVFIGLLICPALAVAEDASIALEVNGAAVETDAAPYVEDGVTMVPVLFATGPLHAVLTWEKETNVVTLLKERVTIEMKVGSSTLKVNGMDYALSVPVQNRDYRTYIPVRAVSELFGATVHWNREKGAVQVYFPEDEFAVVGYYYDADSLTMAEKYIRDFSEVIHFNFLLSADGHVAERTHYVPDLYEECDPLLRVNGKDNMFIVTGFSREVLNAVLPDSALRKQAIDDICSILSQKGYSGVDLDFESMPVEQRDNYVTFVKELRAAMPRTKLLSLSLHPRENERQTWRDGYDYAGLAQAADQLIFMFYDQHYSGGEPGPVAGADWMERNIQYLLQYVPREKMIAGLGCYGYNWPVNGGSGSSIRIATARQVASERGITVERDEESGVPYFTYTNDEGQERIVWFEDEQSLSQKVGLAVKYRLSGIALWRMGFFPDEVLDAILDAAE